MYKIATVFCSFFAKHILQLVRKVHIECREKQYTCLIFGNCPRKSVLLINVNGGTFTLFAEFIKAILYS